MLAYSGGIREWHVVLQQVPSRNGIGKKGPGLRRWWLPTHPSIARRPQGCTILTGRGSGDRSGFLRRQFLQDGDLPFTDVLTEEAISEALATVTGWLDHIFSPLVTLWVFLDQVPSADHSCRAAVARLIAHRLSPGQRPCSAETGAYCQARQRLPESFFADVACSVGRRLDAQAERDWLWRRRRVYMFDGTTGSF